jgi:putative SOS response-associated peptidase YedK
MCFTVNVNIVKEELERRYDAVLIDHDNYRPSYYYHAFAFPDLPVICSEDPGKIKLMRWGLIPNWVRSSAEASDIRLKTFNARGVSLAEKPAFSESIKARRCLIPVRGFFEWQHIGKEKIPWYIYGAIDPVISLAGLYDSWNDYETGEKLSTFTIITTGANELLARIHNSKERMPVILDRESEKSWLNLSSEDALSLLNPCPDELLKAHTISPLINSKTAEKNVPALIEPYEYYRQNLLF